VKRRLGASRNENTTMGHHIAKFFRDENGATAIEYGLIASILGVVLIAAFNNVGGKMKSTFNDIANNLSS